MLFNFLDPNYPIATVRRARSDQALQQAEAEQAQLVDMLAARERPVPEDPWLDWADPGENIAPLAESCADSDAVPYEPSLLHEADDPVDRANREIDLLLYEQ